MAEVKESKYTTPKADAFSSMAFWQFLAFIALLCFVWASELFDLPALVFGAEDTKFNLYRVSLLSAAIITSGIIVVGHSYERQRRLVKELLMTCLYCHRVKTDKGKWMHVEDYFLAHYPVAVDRNACPDCQQMLKSVEAMHKDNQAK